MVNLADTTGVPACMLKMCLHKFVYEWAKGTHVWSRAVKAEWSRFLCKCATLKITLIAITPPSIQQAHAATLLYHLRQLEKDFYSLWPNFLFSIWTAVPLPWHTLLDKPVSFLGKHSIKTKEMNFIAPFSLPLLIDKDTTLTLRDFGYFIT